MTTTLEEFHEKFRVDELTVLRTANWTWSVRPVQSTVGAGVLSLNRFATSLAEISSEEAGDLAIIAPRIEAALHTWTEPDRINYLMLMMVDAHLHFHVLPRYAQPRTLLGHQWLDSGWPALPALGDNSDISQSDLLLEIRDALRRP